MVYVKYCRLVNCQSHRDTVYEFIDGLNIFRAEDNSAGKSVFFKMVKLVGSPSYLKTEKERRQYISHWAEFASAMFVFSDNSAGMVRVYPKQLVYYYTPDSSTVAFSAYAEPPADFIKALSLITDSKSKFIANVLDMDQEMLFVKSDSKTNDDLVTLLTTDERLNRLKDISEEKIKEFKDHRKYLNDTVDRIEIQLARFNYYDTNRLASAIDNVEKAIRIHEEIAEVFRELEHNEGLLVRDMDYDLVIAACSLHEELSKPLFTLERYNPQEVNEDLLHGLEVYEKIQSALEITRTIKQPVPSDIMHTYENLLNAVVIAMDIKQVVDVGYSMEALDLYDAANLAVFNCKRLYNSTQDYTKAESKVASIWAELNELGKRVPCVLYGEVQHVNGECIPVGD